MKKRTLSSLAATGGLLIVSVLALGACSSNPAPSPAAASPAAATDPAAAKLLPPAVRSAGQISFATDATYAPFETVDTQTNKIVGIDADLTAALGRALGLKVTLDNVSFDDIIPALQAGRYDAAASAISVTPAREKVVDFVVYMRAGSGLAVQKGNPHHLQMDPLALCGHNIGAPTGTIQAVTQLPEISSQCVKAGKPAVTISQFPSQEAVNLAVSSGRVQAAMAASISLAVQVKASDGALELAPGEDFDPAPIGIAFPKGSDLVPAVQKALTDMATSGELKQIVTRWGMPSDSVYTVPQ
jgi:polar amino acid transport system substrate-binding protein